MSVLGAKWTLGYADALPGLTQIGSGGLGKTSGRSSETLEAQREPLFVWTVFGAIWQMYRATIEPL